MEWIYDPAAWAGLTTLVVLEIVLGIDNLIFIAILSDKLPPQQRQKARILGLSLALLMRLCLLTGISHLAQLTTPLFTLMAHAFSARDLIMILGGTFLLFKGTMELHEKLEGAHSGRDGPINYAKFWQVIVQIVILDAVFSLDAVITAIGMTHHLPVMMLAVCIAMVLMIIASNKLMNFVSAHPTVVILCLGFLLMIGFSLIVEGLGFHIPKGYLYAAIAFSIIIESFNQLALRNRRKTYARMDPRARMSQAVLSLLGGTSENPNIQTEIAHLKTNQDDGLIFDEQERLMMQRVMRLSEQTVQAVMTPRKDLMWIDLADDIETLRKDILECPYSYLVVAGNGEIEEPAGIIQKKDLADHLLSQGNLTEIGKLIIQPIILPETVTVLQALDAFRNKRIHMAFIVDEYGTLEGLVTLTDVVEAIAGDLPEDHEGQEFRFEKNADGSVSVDGSITLQELAEILEETNLPEGDYNTVAGVALHVLRRMPQKGDVFQFAGWDVRIEAMDGRRVGRLHFTKHHD
ncbi:MAG: TerC family protein [Micavibrio aeruginosavorus]|uniref:TerC family protein n=1 Tax=Micavibrio aeruginosavorus TaxID=349221 RepID=A0A7T5UHN9_9BACT|nr:MAG: TerC family protein [Micavibrio aeruginosavorus]